MPPSAVVRSPWCIIAGELTILFFTLLSTLCRSIRLGVGALACQNGSRRRATGAGVGESGHHHGSVGRKEEMWESSDLKQRDRIRMEITLRPDQILVVDQPMCDRGLIMGFKSCSLIRDWVAEII